mmetsp:Transcript_10387/g.16232  ORF Transcript_10387/g.16232 Transcript_10387/m.16232 type:complete len:115 (-) Transcript_10387:1749-2093(-)
MIVAHLFSEFESKDLVSFVDLACKIKTYPVQMALSSRLNVKECSLWRILLTDVQIVCRWMSVLVCHIGPGTGDEGLACSCEESDCLATACMRQRSLHRTVEIMQTFPGNGDGAP